jgi:cobalt-zinc-cadmium resistance protein CzcA
MTREYQVRVDPSKLVAYGLSVGQLQTQLANNNINAGGSFIESGLQQLNVRAVGLIGTIEDIGDTVIHAKNGTALSIRDVATVEQGPKIRLGKNGKSIHRSDGKVIDYDDVVEGIVLLRKGANADETLAAIHEKVQELNEHILPPGVKVVAMLDRSDLLHLTTHTVLHNLTEGIVLVLLIFVIYVILYAMFKSSKWALLILGNVAVAPLGGILALLITGTHFSVSSGVGFLPLFGVSVETGVIMLEYINQIRGQGFPVEAAAIEGAVLRLRPMMMTMLVASLGLLPAALSHGIGSDSQRPFAIVIVGGLVAALLLSVFLLPTLYVLTAGPKDKLPQPWSDFAEGL